MDETYHALIIDDDKYNVSVLARLLEQQGVSHTAITQPRLLDEVLDSIQYLNVIFLDLEMPNADGYQLLQHLNQLEKTSEIPVVAYTVHTSEMATAHQKGFHSFLAKPIDPENFPDQLKKILNNERVWGM